MCCCKYRSRRVSMALEVAANASAKRHRKTYNISIQETETLSRYLFSKLQWPRKLQTGQAHKPTIFFNSAGHCGGGEVDRPTHFIIALELPTSRYIHVGSHYSCKHSYKNMCAMSCSSYSRLKKLDDLCSCLSITIIH
jgi:hypothetical protein